MKKIWEKLTRATDLKNNEEGLTTVEYAIVLALIAVVAIGAWRALGSVVNQKASDAASAIGQ